MMRTTTRRIQRAALCGAFAVLFACGRGSAGDEPPPNDLQAAPGPGMTPVPTPEAAPVIGAVEGLVVPVGAPRSSDCVCASPACRCKPQRAGGFECLDPEGGGCDCTCPEAGPSGDPLGVMRVPGEVPVEGLPGHDGTGEARLEPRPGMPEEPPAGEEAIR